MPSYNEQVMARKASEQETFSDSLQKIAGAVMEKHLQDALIDDRIRTTNAIGEILKFYHFKPVEIPDTIQTLQEALDYSLQPHGIMYRCLKLEGDWDRHAMGPMLGTRTDDGGVVALLPKGVQRYQFYDYKRKTHIPVGPRNRKQLAKDAIVFYKPFPNKAINIKALLGFMLRQLSFSDIFTLVLTAVLLTGLGLLLPKLNQLLFSTVLDTGNHRLLLGTAIFMLSITVSMAFYSATKDLLSTRLEIKFYNNCYSATLMRVLSLPTSFFKQYNAGELASRIDVMSDLSNSVANVLFSTTLTSLLSLAYLGEILVIAPSLAAPAIVVTVCLLLVTVLTILVHHTVARKKMFAESKEKGVSYELISGVKKIRLAGAQKRAFAKWGDHYAKTLALTYNPPLILVVSPVLTSAISLLGTIFIYGIAIRDGVSVAEYYAFNTAFGSLTAAVLALSGVAASLAEIFPAMEMLNPILLTAPEESGKRTAITDLFGEIEINNVTFRYENQDAAVLNKLSLKIEPGQYVAITGRSGCGKSTLLRILLGFEEPQTGAIYYDGRDLQTIVQKSLRRRIGTVTQDGQLFAGTIFSNIAVSAPNLTLEEAWEAAEIAGIADDIRQMPQQMDTLVTDGDGGISGGQRQRLLIARAIAPKPKILFLDEATSALDNVTQQKVSEAMDSLNCTRLVIAHRLSTIRQCDRVIVLDQGKIVEDGTYDELMKKNGFFAELVARQQY